MFPQSLMEGEEHHSDCNEDDKERGQDYESVGYDRYPIHSDHTAPTFDRMVSMPAYMHQKAPSPRSSPRMYFRTKLPLTNPYQYRKQFNTSATNVKGFQRAISKFRRNTLPREVPVLREAQSDIRAESDNQDGCSSYIETRSSLKRADSFMTNESIEGKGVWYG